ncbi:MAG TPA: ABC transporter ATP-binding protein [Bryobacteraceae bacterium]|nr:ABC transporter ATP-binding protein [Bryobacteraceae bacterium]
MKRGVCWRLMGSGTDTSFKALDLTRRYQSGQSELVVFAALNLDVYRGERLALIGESGAGKSTLLHLLGGLDRPSEGTIFFETREISGLSDAELSNYRNREIGFVWQTHYLLPEFTALENVMMPLLIRNVSQPEASVAATRMLEEVGLKERATHRAGELSGGEQQRVALARALVGRPKALLADEPTGNLDFKTGEMIMDLLDELHRSHQLTSIYVTHNQKFAARCDRVLRLDKGELFSLDSSSQGLRE